MSRTAFRYRLYYNIQTVSKYYYATDRFFKLEKDIEKLSKTRMKTTYRGNETRTYKRYKSLLNKRNYYDYKRYESINFSLMKLQNKINR